MRGIVYVGDGCYSRWKAIDFESSRGEGEEVSCEATAAYCSPEVAKEMLARANGASHKPLLASHKMDIMALGWAVYEIANDMKSYWENQSPPITEHGDILNALACLRDEDVKRDIERTFAGTQFEALRTWLVHALRVHPKDRASALELRKGTGQVGLIVARERRTVIRSVEEQPVRNEGSAGRDAASCDLCRALRRPVRDSLSRGVFHRCRSLR